MVLQVTGHGLQVLGLGFKGRDHGGGGGGTHVFVGMRREPHQDLRV